MGKNGDDGDANYKQVAAANNVYNGMRKAAAEYDAHISLSSLNTRSNAGRPSKTMHMVVLSVRDFELHSFLVVQCENDPT